MNLITAIKSIRILPKKRKLIPLDTVWGASVDPEHLLDEYPRPQMQRADWINLNGYWNYTVISVGKKQRATREGKILVPFSPEAPLSGASFQLKPGELLIYERPLPVTKPNDDRRCILHFGAVDQRAIVRINGTHVGTNTNGYLPFAIDITNYLNDESNTLSVYVEDLSDSSYHSVGKQRLKRGGMFYTAQSGIWQTVWLEWVPQTYICEFNAKPLFDKETVHVTVCLNHALSCLTAKHVTCRVIADNGNIISSTTLTNHSDNLSCYSGYCDVNHVHPWTPDDPYLYRLEIQAGSDLVKGYFAMRTFGIEKDENQIPRFTLNHSPLFLKGILDQGYWPDGLYTAPSDDALIFDIYTMKTLGFNMIRKHAKIDCARWYYHCDRLGMIVWQDMVNGGAYHAPLMTWMPALFPRMQSHFSDRLSFLLGRRKKASREELLEDCMNTIQVLKAFPCISTWVLFNEGWGQYKSAKLTELVRDVDPDHLIDSASGWFDQGAGDFKSIHNYFAKQYIVKDPRACVISEFGGYTYRCKGHTSTSHLYGYKHFKTIEEFQNAYHHLMHDEIEPLIEQGLCGCVYTQLSDIEEELNGILTYDRKVQKI